MASSRSFRAGLVFALPTLAGILAGCGKQAIQTLMIRKEARTDLLSLLPPYAERIAPHAPAPSWRRTLANPEIDELVAVDSGLVLVGELKMSNLALAYQELVPEYGDYQAIEPRTGAVRYRIPRDGEEGVAYQVIAVDPRLIIARHSAKAVEVSAYEKASGQRRWSQTLPGPLRGLAEDGTNLFLVAAGRMVAMDRESGRTLWEHGNLPDSLGPRSELRMAQGNLWWSDGIRILALDRVSGKVLHSETAPSRTLLGGMVEHAGGMLLYFMDGEIRNHGRVYVRWKTGKPLVPGSLVIREGKVFGVSATDGRGDEIVAGSIGSGENLWSVRAGSRVRSDLLIHADRLVLCTDSAILVMDPKTGGLAGRVGFDPNQLEGTSPDMLLAGNGNAVIHAREFSVGSLDLDRMEWRWRHVAAPQKATFLYGSRKYAPAPAASRMGSISPEMFRVFQPLSFSEIHKGRMLYHENMAARYNPNRNLSSRAFDRGPARYHEMEAEKAREKMNEAQLAEGLATVGAALGAAALYSLKAKNDEASRTRRFAMWERLAQRTLSGTLQGGFWIRPFEWKTCLGFLVVRLEDGAWKEIPTQVKESLITGQLPFLDAQIALIGLPENMLISKGISFDPARWEPFNPILKLTAVKRQLFGLDLSQQEFSPPGSFASHAWSRSD